MSRGNDGLDAAGEDDVFDDVPCGLLSTRPDGTIVRVNQTFLDWTGHRSEGLVGRKRFQDLLTPGGRIYHETHYAPLLRMQGSAREVAVELECPGGDRLPVLVSSVLRQHADGRPEAIHTAVFAATDRREYERELMRARQRAENSEARARVLAETLQQSFLPPSPPEIPGLLVAARYRPAGDGSEVGGDFYDVFETTRGSWVVVVGDVCGKGAEAATVTALARHTVRAAAIQTRQPRLVLGTLNEVLVRHGGLPFCTAVYGRFRLDGLGRVRLVVSSGGHPLPLRVRRDGAVDELGRPGILLGVVDAPALSDTTVELAPGDLVAFYTDGLIEARRGNELFGDGRLRSLLTASRGDDVDAVASRLVDEVISFQDGYTRDDVAVVVVGVPTGR